MTIAMTREQAASAVAAASAERDGIQANLLDLDSSFGKRLLDGVTLAGVSKQHWEAAAAELAALWDIFTAYAAVVDRAAELMASARRVGSPELAEITTMLNGTSVVLTRAPMPLARRDLTDRGRSDLTLAAAVAEMKRSFASVTEVVAAAESVWNETAEGLSEIGTAIGTAKEQAAELGDDEVTGALIAAAEELGRLREVLNSDPLALWQHGRVDTARLDRLRKEAAAAVARVGDLARLRADAQRRIAAVTAAVAASAAAWQDAKAARDRAATKIATALPPPPAEPAGLDAALAALDTLRAAGRWARLAAELDAIGTEAAAATERYRDAERAAVALLGRRDELRGLLDAYQAKAASLGAAEDAELTARYQQARDLLWTAPCDLVAASAAVTDYQQAILALGGRRQP
jgi:chromosome segregation ATPase